MNNLDCNGAFVFYTKPNGIDRYETVNTFKKPGTRKNHERLFELMNLYLDIDFKDSQINVNINNEPEIYDYVDLLIGRCCQLKILDPSQIYFSGYG